MDVVVPSMSRIITAALSTSARKKKLNDFEQWITHFETNIV